MEIVEIRSKAESLDCSFDIFLDMGGGIRHAAVSEGIETAFRGNCIQIVSLWFLLSSTNMITY